MSITVNGREYATPDEMPADVRRLYEEAMQQLSAEAGSPGRPGGSGRADSPGVHVDVRVTRRVVVNGREVTDPDALPAEARAALRAALDAPEAAGLLAGGQDVHATPAGAAGARTPVVPRDSDRAGPWSEPPTRQWRLSVRVSPMRLVLWLAVIGLLVYLYLARH